MSSTIPLPELCIVVHGREKGETQVKLGAQVNAGVEDVFCRGYRRVQQELHNGGLESMEENLAMTQQQISFLVFYWF